VQGRSSGKFRCSYEQNGLPKGGKIMQKKIFILLAGHTDATGSDEHNLELSRRRAQSVAGYLATQNVDSARVATEGYGKSQPIADNDTVEGRAQNRRVEVAIWANEKLKKVAKEKTS
jgi:flagellar motor protein MotB